LTQLALMPPGGRRLSGTTVGDLVEERTPPPIFTLQDHALTGGVKYQESDTVAAAREILAEEPRYN
jgi:hypothetical protein